MENNELNLEVLESRLEMESLAALEPTGGDTTPISICHFW
jgi:hypothetical protein